MKPYFWVARKELREALRDKRVRGSAIIAPMFMMLFVLSLIGFIGKLVGKAENQRLHIVRTSNSIVDVLKKSGMKIEEVDSVEAGEKLIKDGKAEVVLNFDRDFDAEFKAKKVAKVEALIDAKSTKGQIALAAFSEVVKVKNMARVKELLTSGGVSADLAEPIQLKKTPVKIGETNVSDVLLSFLPYLVTIYAFFGGFGTGPELVAGEKEKYTLETLLISPVRRRDLALGKFLALATICFMSSMSAILGVVLAGVSGLSLFKAAFPNGLGFGPLEFLTMIVVLIPTVALFAGILLAVSSYAKNLREAQQYLALVNIIVLMPAVFSQFIGFTDLGSARWINMVPVLNTSVSLRNALLGKTDPIALAITVAVGAVLGLLCVRIAVAMFEREQVLVRV